MKRSSLSLVFPILTALALLSCSSDPTAPEDLLGEDRYVSVFTELLVINQLREEQLDGVSRDYLKEQVFEEYNVTLDQFERAHRYYQKQPVQQLKRLDKIDETLTEERDRLQGLLSEDRKRLADSLITPDTLSPPNPAEVNNKNN